MAVKLEYYLIDEASGTKQKLGGSLSFGNMFKGSQSKIPITIFNAGDTTAYSPVVTIKQYPGSKYNECYTWKKLSFDKTDGYQYTLTLPDIPPNSWLRGKDVQSEDFNNYPVVAGTKPDQSWLLWEGTSLAWEVYNGWLQHNVDTQDGRALWTELSSAADFEFSMRVTIRDDVYGGLIVRDEGDSDTGYIILIQAVKSELGYVASNEGVIQVYSGKFTNGMNSWRKLYTSSTIGIRGTHDYFKVKLTGNVFEFWYKNEGDENPKFRFIDTNNYHTKASRPIIVCHAGFGSVLTYFDDIRMEVENDNGVIWIDNQVDAKTGVYNLQYSLLDVSYGGVE